MNILIKKILKKIINSFENFTDLNILLLVKYVYNKVYWFLYNDLLKFYQTFKYKKNFKSLTKNLTELELFELVIYNNYKMIPFYNYNYKFLIKKIFLLKQMYGSKLSIFSYILLVKSIEWFSSTKINLSKIESFKYIKFMIKIFSIYEGLIIINTYKLAQIYSKYGVNESYVFFEKLLLKNHFDEHLLIYTVFNTPSIYIIYVYELFLFVFVSILFILSLINILHVMYPFKNKWDIVDFYIREKDLEIRYEYVFAPLNLMSTYADKMSLLTAGGLYELWGIF